MEERREAELKDMKVGMWFFAKGPGLEIPFSYPVKIEKADENGLVIRFYNCKKWGGDPKSSKVEITFAEINRLGIKLYVTDMNDVREHILNERLWVQNKIDQFHNYDKELESEL